MTKKLKYTFKYICSKCKRISYRSIGGWRLECKCGAYLICPADPWKEQKSTAAEELKQFRLEKKWSQELLAEELGIDQGTISRIERGIIDCPPEVKRWLSKVRAI